MKSIKERCEELAIERGYDSFNEAVGTDGSYVEYEIRLKATEEYYKNFESLNMLSAAAHGNALSKGFYEDGKGQNMAEKLMLVVSEVAEALEADRVNTYSVCGSLTKDLEVGKDFTTSFELHVKNTFEDEIADVIIRCLELSGWKNIDIDWHVRMKMRYNSTREKMHGKKY